MIPVRSRTSSRWIAASNNGVGLLIRADPDRGRPSAVSLQMSQGISSTRFTCFCRRPSTPCWKMMENRRARHLHPRHHEVQKASSRSRSVASGDFTASRWTTHKRLLYVASGRRRLMDESAAAADRSLSRGRRNAHALFILSYLGAGVDNKVDAWRVSRDRGSFEISDAIAVGDGCKNRTGI